MAWQKIRRVEAGNVIWCDNDDCLHVFSPAKDKCPKCGTPALEEFKELARMSRSGELEAAPHPTDRAGRREGG